MHLTTNVQHPLSSSHSASIGATLMGGGAGVNPSRIYPLGGSAGVNPSTVYLMGGAAGINPSGSGAGINPSSR